ncbi:MAG: FAD-dependent monooxygenase [Actinomycetota bacterium]|nr:FAD-dependent monooxygenase [Actinomycetota bacterium]
MKVAVVGGGPAGLYLSLLLKKADADHETVVFERNPKGATYGWGVVFSDRTLTSFREADPKTYTRITDDFIIWDAIDVRYRDEVIRCGGQVFSGISRKALLSILTERCEELGVGLVFDHEIIELSQLGDFDLIVGADGIRSSVRAAHEDAFRPRFDNGSSRYIWLGTRHPFDSFTFVFRSNEDGFFQAHAYPFDGSFSTFIVECDEESWRCAGLHEADEATSIAYCQELFSSDLGGHRLESNNSKWVNFVTLKNRRWHHENVVLLGDAAHTAHFSIGSGTKLAMEDSIALVDSLETHWDLAAALDDYQLERKPRVERFQEAARQSQTYFEDTSRYVHMEPLQFAFHLLSRSGRIDYDNLRMRDPHFVGSVDRWFLRQASSERLAPSFAAPPAFAPIHLRALPVSNRVAVNVEPSYSAVEGVPVQGELEVAARSGAGLVFTSAIAVSDPGRITPGCPGLYNDEQLEVWRGALGRAAGVSTASFIATLSHSGPRGATRPRTLGADLPLRHGQWGLVAASPLPYTRRSAVPEEMGRAHMTEVLEDFAAAATRASAAGFDGLELQLAHGYLLSTFLSPLANHRADDYGGGLESRLRYPLEVFEAVRAAAGRMPVGVSLDASDWARGGTELEDAVVGARAFGERGCAFVRVGAGQAVPGFAPRYDPYFLTHYADRLRNETGIPTIATGDIATIDHVNTIVAGGRADLCLMRV